MRLHLLQPAPLRRRLWQAASLLAIVTLVFAAGNALQTPDKKVTRAMLGHDFLAFYTAGSFVKNGDAADLYDLPKVAAFEADVAKQNGLDITIDLDARKFGPWWNPPFYAWAFAPLAYLAYPQALAVWTTLNLIALAGAVVLLMRMLVPPWLENDALGRPADWRTSGLVPFLLLLSMPFVQAISHGQNTPASLLILAAAATFWRNRRAVLTGACIALLGYKPQLAAVVAVVAVGSLGLRAVCGMGLVGSVLVLLTQGLMPDLLVHYVRQMPVNLHFMQIEHAYLWERHATLLGFWRLLLQGREAGETWKLTRLMHGLSLLLVGGMLVRAVWSHLRRRSIDHCWTGLTQRTWRDRLIAATVTAAPLLMPFYFDYDLLLLAVAAVLLSAEALVRPVDLRTAGGDRWLVRSWVALYAWTLINPGLATVTHVNGTVILLAIVSLQMSARATRHGTLMPTRLPLPTPWPVPPARAA